MPSKKQGPDIASYTQPLHRITRFVSYGSYGSFVGKTAPTRCPARIRAQTLHPIPNRSTVSYGSYHTARLEAPLKNGSHPMPSKKQGPGIASYTQSLHRITRFVPYGSYESFVGKAAPTRCPARNRAQTLHHIPNRSIVPHGSYHTVRPEALLEKRLPPDAQQET